MPSWYHISDGLTGWGLCTLVWLGAFLQTLKVWIKLCRNHGGDLMKALQLEGLHAAAAMIKKITLPAFAEWRWRKLAAYSRAAGNAMLIVLGAPFIYVLGF